MGELPKDCSARAICTRSRGIFAYQLDAYTWEWHEQTGTDHGTDIVLELSSEGCFSGKRIEGQLKGSSNVDYLKNGKISFDLDVKTANYALNNANAFVLFLVDIKEENVFFLPIQDFFIDNPERFDAAENNSTSVSVHFDAEYTLKNKPEELIEVAYRVYIGGPSRGMKRIIDK